MKEYKISYDDYMEDAHLGVQDGKNIIENVGTFYYKNGLSHREDGPAHEYSDGKKEWFFNGYRHRLDGPAIEFANGDVAYYIDAERFNSKEKYEKLAYILRNKLENYL